MACRQSPTSTIMAWRETTQTRCKTSAYNGNCVVLTREGTTFGNQWPCNQPCRASRQTTQRREPTTITSRRLCSALHAQDDSQTASCTTAALRTAQPASLSLEAHQQLHQRALSPVTAGTVTSPAPCSRSTGGCGDGLAAVPALTAESMRDSCCWPFCCPAERCLRRSAITSCSRWLTTSSGLAGVLSTASLTLQGVQGSNESAAMVMIKTCYSRGLPTCFLCPNKRSQEGGKNHHHWAGTAPPLLQVTANAR
eukprot:GHRQ01038119.1.p1 GENE.GHRQ01038119.1~~GHRQ01038119.1.p1  ORF type:complete len:253 (-),score=39.24 GHRQ01038119.1:350-1108(-)